jgi:hypothetical protein
LVIKIANVSWTFSTLKNQFFGIKKLQLPGPLFAQLKFSGTSAKTYDDVNKDKIKINL